MRARNVSTLAYAVRGRVVLKYYGQLCVSLIGLTGAALLPALLEGAWDMAARIAVVTAVLGLGGLSLGRLRVSTHIQANEALVVVVGVFATAALALVWPYMAAGLRPVDALFEAVSGVTTTGLSTLPSVEGHSLTFLFLRAWSQWYGGLVIVVLALALLLQPGRVAKRLTEVEGAQEDLVGGTRMRARRVLGVYLVLSGVGLLVLWAAGASPFDALLHTLAAVSTGGFSSHDASLAGLGNWTVQAVTTVLCLAGAISFALYYRAWSERWHVLWQDRELRLLLALALAGTLLLAASMAVAGTHGWREIAAHAPLLALSAQSTAGFATLAVGELDPASKVVLMVGMLIGGDLGSTAGGIKVLRLLVLLRLAYLVVVRTSLPRHAVVETRVAGARMEPDAVLVIVTVAALYGFVVIASWLPFLAAGQAALDSLFDVVSAVGTVGLSAGVTGPGLPAGLKLLLCLDMLLGRLEVVAVLVVFYPYTWIGRKDQN